MVIDALAEVLPTAAELAESLIHDLSIKDARVRSQLDSDLHEMLARLIPPESRSGGSSGHSANLAGFSGLHKLDHVWTAPARRGKEGDGARVLMELILIRKELAELKVAKSAVVS